MVVDIGLHCDTIDTVDTVDTINNNNKFITFNLVSATDYIKKITHLSDKEINAILLKILASPAKSCTQEFARYVMSKHKLEFEQLGYDFYDIIYHIPLNMTEMTNLISELKNKN